MCRITRKGTVPWKEGHREQIILLEYEVDVLAGKEVGKYLGFRVRENVIKFADLPKKLHPHHVLEIIQARANQIKSYRTRNKEVPSFKEFIKKRNEKQMEKGKNESGE